MELVAKKVPLILAVVDPVDKSFFLVLPLLFACYTEHCALAFELAA
jgi:hypothetical protein